jgi:N6-adenosine-specific RNA methylase IME4
MSYKCVSVDPPWPEHGGGKIKRGADRHYSLLKVKDIAPTIMAADKWQPDLEGCHLWLWVTNNYLKAGLEVMEDLGFRYVTNMAWIKVKDYNLQIGLGQYLRGAHELVLFGVMGKTMLPEVRNIPSVVVAPRTKHSRKPQEAYDAIERVSPGPRLEMFAREARPNWSIWGDQAPEV